jgi:hypothetical protein
VTGDQLYVNSLCLDCIGEQWGTVARRVDVSLVKRHQPGIVWISVDSCESEDDVRDREILNESHVADTHIFELVFEAVGSYLTALLALWCIRTSLKDDFPSSPLFQLLGQIVVLEHVDDCLLATLRNITLGIEKRNQPSDFVPEWFVSIVHLGELCLKILNLLSDLVGECAFLRLVHVSIRFELILDPLSLVRDAP